MEINWQPIVKIKASLLFQWYVFEGSKKPSVKSSLGIDFGFLNQKIVSDGIFIDLNEWAKLEKTLLLMSESNKDFFQNFIDLCNKFSSELIKTSEKINQLKNFQALDNDQLLEIYLNYQNAVFGLVPFLDITLVLNKIINNQLIELLGFELGIKDKNLQEILLSKLIIPKKKSFFVQETEAILKMADQVSRGKDVGLERDIKRYLDQFAWMSVIAYVGKPHSKEAVKDRINEIIKENPEEQLAKARQVKRKILSDYEEAYEEIKDHPKLTSLINYAREFLYLLNYRLDVFFKVHYLVRPLFQEIGKRFGLTVEELVYLTGEEIIGLLKGKTKPDPEELGKRIENYALIKVGGKFTIKSGERVENVAYGKAKTAVVKGQVANRGRVTGKVKLVFETGDLVKVKRGDILVSPMTRPNMVSAMMKAGGIITDFGGLLCHAAIISREFDVPCVVGTKNATRVFKDGDMVELNAYEGIIRKLS